METASRTRHKAGSRQSSLLLLLVDDDVELSVMLQEFFCEVGHRLDTAFNGKDGLERMLTRTYDLVLLDVMLPQVDGVSVLQQVRKRSGVPIIMLTARSEQHDRILGLNAGADDYVPKPFDPDELYARVRAVLRRVNSQQSRGDGITTSGPLSLNATTREAFLGELKIELTSVEFDVLELLARSSGRIVSRDEITMLIFGREATPYDRFLDVHISHLRRKLEGSKTIIRTVRGVGYVFTGQL